ncbi:MAG: hypothetical protein LBC68_03085 [Prevotellaceae bacterium]|jgi:hypothetical protein|nr:hypothetical protein [Prevotellaceae bacterium]
MATSVISKPEGLCFSGNLPKVKVQSDGEVRVQLLTGDKTLLDETYTPDFDSLVLLDISDVVINELTFTVPDADVFIQPNIKKSFVLKINTVSYNFSALRCGIKDFGDTVTNFLKRNFLTWQPGEKKITRNQPEFLTYHATQTSSLYIFAYYEDGLKLEISIVPMTANNVYTVNIGKILKSLPKTLIKVEAVVLSSGNRISKYQYYLIDPQAYSEQYFLFENSLGGMDSVRCTGELKSEPEFTRESALMGDTERTFFAEKSDIKTQTTDWLTRYDAAWLHDFFMSKKIYLLEIDKLKATVIDEVTAETSSKEDLRSYEFTYRPAESSDYLIIYDKLTEYISAAYANPVCQRIELITTYTSASYVNPICQKVEVTTTYTSAEWTNPVCQEYDDSVSYTAAVWTNPICQMEDDGGILLGILLTVNLKKHSLLANTILITWGVKYLSLISNFRTTISLLSIVGLRQGTAFSIQDVSINVDISGMEGSVAQTLNDIDLFVGDGTEVISMTPDNIGGVPINVRITLN